INSSPDFEAKQAYSIRVQVTDQGGLTFEKVLTVNVANVNETPTDVALSNSTVNENVAAGSPVGTLSPADPDAGGSFSYALVAGTGATDNAAFTVTGNTLSINSSPDFEAKQAYSIRVQVTDQGGLTFEKVLTVNVANVNETPTDVALSNSTVNENVAAGSPVGTLSPADPDAGGSFSYALVAGTGATDNAAFTVTGNTLSINSSPDFEAKQAYSIRVQVTDQGGLTFEKVLTVNVANVNETPTDVALSNSTVNENVAAGSPVGTLSPADPDAGGSFSYALVAGTGATDNAAFTVTGNTLSINSSPDFEAKQAYSIRVQVTDQGGLTFEKVLTVNVANVNETPTDVALSNSTVNENVAAGSPVGTLSPADPDAGGSFSYALVAGTGATDNAAFTVTGNTLSINSSPDFEAKQAYSIRVQVTDQGGLTFEKVLTVNVANVNETPTDVALSNSTVNENVAAGSPVGTLSPADPDAGGSFSYALVAGTGATDNAAFTVTGNTLSINSSPDFEAKQAYSIRVQVTDQGGLTFEKVLTVNVANVNETPTDVALSNSTVNENVAAGSPVGTLSPADPDAGGSFSYALVAGTGAT